MLARGELHCVGATTLDEYRKYIEKDQALARRFQPVLVSLRHNWNGHYSARMVYCFGFSLVCGSFMHY